MPLVGRAGPVATARVAEAERPEQLEQVPRRQRRGRAEIPLHPGLSVRDTEHFQDWQHLEGGEATPERHREHDPAHRERDPTTTLTRCAERGPEWQPPGEKRSPAARPASSAPRPGRSGTTRHATHVERQPVASGSRGVRLQEAQVAAHPSPPSLCPSAWASPARTWPSRVAPSRPAAGGAKPSQRTFQADQPVDRRDRGQRGPAASAAGSRSPGLERGEGGDAAELCGFQNGNSPAAGRARHEPRGRWMTWTSPPRAAGLS